MPLELWGGPECTVNRVGNIYHDQLKASGHHDRPSDMALITGLGLDAVRYPVLWERIAPDAPDERDWSWTDERLPLLRDHGLRVIAGLIHHGSGPRYTGLLAKDFASGLATHARAVAERYPWIEDWTPVNEPLTTARFAALYGLWHPHRRDERSFWQALLNQVEGVIASMRAIREVNPRARLIQTDDLGRTYATVRLEAQAGYDNARRWMAWDLLCGRVKPGHSMWRRLCALGLEPRLRAIAEVPCPPDIMGINHYLTSDRFLDHRLQRYPEHLHGGNPLTRFADTEAVRVLEPPPDGLHRALLDAWERYGIPLAITEVHNGCTREEQMRWFIEAWALAKDLRAQGVDLRAVTCWSLFGSQGWNSLLTGAGRYEPGVYDISGGQPRPTAMADMLRALPSRDAPHPTSAGAGWWRRTIRSGHPAVSRPAPMREHSRVTERPLLPGSAPLLILGATGTLGQALSRACHHRGILHVLSGRAQLDLSSRESISGALDGLRPWAVINAAGWVRVDEAEDAQDACMAANCHGAFSLAEEAGRRGIACVSLSSDLVFDGRAGRAYVESDAAAPLNAYGRSKHAAELAIAALPGAQLMIRTAAFFSAFDPHNFAAHLLYAASRGESFAAADDHIVSPTYVPLLADAMLDLLIDGADGLWHLSNGEALSWAGFAGRILDRLALPADRLEAVPGNSLGWRAARPPYAALDSERGRLMVSLDDALDRFAHDLRGARPDLLSHLKMTS